MIQGTIKKNLSRTRFGVPPSTALLEKTLSLLQSIKKYPQNLFNLIPARRTLYLTRNMHNIPLLYINFNFCKPYFSNILLLTETTWILDFENLRAFLILETKSLNSIYDCRNLKGLKPITGLRLDLTEHSESAETMMNNNFFSSEKLFCSLDI